MTPPCFIYESFPKVWHFQQKFQFTLWVLYLYLFCLSFSLISFSFFVKNLKKAIDPLAFKNLPVSQEFILATLAHYGVVQAKKHDEEYQMRLEQKLVLAKGIKYQMRLNRRLSVLEGYATEKECVECPSESSGEDSDWAYAVPPYVVEVSRYDPYKGPFEVVVAFVEAMRTLDLAVEGMRFILKNCRFVYAASTPGDNPTGAQILRNLKLFIRNVDVLKLLSESKSKYSICIQTVHIKYYYYII